MSSPIRNVPILISLEVSPFRVLFFSLFVSPCSCFSFSFGFLSRLSQVVGLGRSEALRSPKGEAQAEANDGAAPPGLGRASLAQLRSP